MARKLSVDEREMFDVFMRENPECWSCGWRKGKPRIAPAYAAPVRLENHHIVGGSGRKHVRPNLARLCSICHRVFHGDRIRLSSGDVLPPITLGQILSLKSEHDPDWFDVQILDGLAIGVMPPVETPNRFYGGCGL